MQWRYGRNVRSQRWEECAPTRGIVRGYRGMADTTYTTGTALDGGSEVAGGARGGMEECDGVS